MMADPNSQLSKSLAANMSAAQQDALFKRQVELQELAIKDKAASRPRSSGGGSLSDEEVLKAKFQKVQS